MQQQSSPPQVIGNIFGNACLPEFDPFSQFHDHFIALFTPEQRQHGEQRFTGGMTNNDPLRYLDQVGKMGADMQHVVDMSLFGLRLQNLNADDLAHPGSSGFEIIQKDVIRHFLPVKQVDIFRVLIPGPLQDAGFQKAERQTFVRDAVRDSSDGAHLIRGLRQRTLSFPQEKQRRGLQPCVSVFSKISGKFDELSAFFFIVILPGQAADGVKQSEGCVVIQLFRFLVLAQQGIDKTGLRLRKAVPQHRVKDDV